MVLTQSYVMCSIRVLGFRVYRSDLQTLVIGQKRCGSQRDIAQPEKPKAGTRRHARSTLISAKSHTVGV